MTTTRQKQIVIELPHPPSSLSPNGRVHWSVRNRDAQKMRTIARVATLCEMDLERWPSWKPVRPWPGAVMDIEWRHSGRRPDDDNLIARLKSVRDGIADTGLVRDDAQITTGQVTFVKVRRDEQCVVLTLTRIEDER